MIRSCSFEVRSRLVLFLLSCLPGMLSKDAAVKVWPTFAQAVWFLLWIGLLSLPRCCPHGHEWNRFYSNFDGRNVFLHCVAPMILVPDSEDEEEGQRKKLCNRKMTWRQKGTLPYALCRTMRPDQYVALLYWFASDAPYTTCKKEADVTPEIWSKAVTRLRSILWLWLCKDSEKPLNGRGKVVCIDETFICKKKRAKGGFQARSTAGTKQIILGMIELDLATRKATGRIFLSEIPDRSKKTLRKHIQRQVVPGTLIFTDSLKSYAFLGRKTSNYVHRCVNHKARDFSRRERIFGEEIVVSTNSAEGLFGRLKSYFRARGAKKVPKHNYGKLLAEFFWRQYVSAHNLSGSVC